MGAEALLDIFAGLILPVAIVGFLATVAEAIVEGFIAPIFDRYEKLKPHKFWLFYVAWVVSGVLVFLSGVNLFEQFIPDYAVVGQVLTSVIAGRGSNFLHDLFSARRTRIEADKRLARLVPCDDYESGAEELHFPDDPGLSLKWEGLPEAIEDEE